MVRDALVGAMVLAAVLLVGFMVTRLGTLSHGEGVRVVMYFDDATGLIETAPVTVAGVKVGSVRAIEYSPRGAKTVATIRRDVVLHADARASVRAKSLLGEKLVAIEPGTESAGPLAGGEIPTRPAADIDRMAAALARLAERVDPEDVKQVVHGLAVALGEDGAGTSVPEAIRDVGRDLHRLAASLEGASGSAREVTTRLRPVLEKLDALAARADKTLGGLQPAVEKAPALMAALERAARRIDALLARAEKVDAEQVKHEVRKILEEEGVYVRMRPKKVKDPKAPQRVEEDEPEDAGLPLEREDSPVPR